MGKNRSQKDDQKNLNKSFSEKMGELSEGSRVKYSGLGGQKKVEPMPNFVQASCEKVIKGSTNSWIVMGRDRPGTRFSGVGAGVDSHASLIDVCVGRASKDAAVEDENGEPIYFNNDLKSDAARIYIAQKTSIDKNFGLVPGRVGNYNGQLSRSAIALKADNIRLVARHGIKLVTRTDDEYSTGGSSSEVRGIDLIAGNDDSDLQPMVKGRNLRDLLKIMCEDLRTVTGAFHKFTIAQLKINKILAAHTHLDPATGTTGPSIESAVVLSLDSLERSIVDIPNQIIDIVNKVVSDIEFLKPSGRYILSGKNNLN